jgi:tetratricopeptide (TPR) repeat protein
MPRSEGIDAVVTSAESKKKTTNEKNALPSVSKYKEKHHNLQEGDMAITAPENIAESPARVIGHIDLEHQLTARQPRNTETGPDGFLFGTGEISAHARVLRHEQARLLAEIDELQAANRFSDIIGLCHPLEENFPELIEAGLDGPVRCKLSFALCHDGRQEQAIECLKPVISGAPENALAHYSIGYAALDFLFQARTRRQVVPAGQKSEMIRLAHHHFRQAIELRPDSVTFCYRRAILYKDVEGKFRQAIPLFEQAITNWRALSPEQQRHYHQQRPKYAKSLYHLGSCLLKTGQSAACLKTLQALMREDDDHNHMQPLFKHFAMAKALFSVDRFKESLDHLETAAHCAEKGQPTDFIWELAARAALGLGRPEEACKYLKRIEPNRRRPYIRWTEGAVLTALGRLEEAKKILHHSANSDRRSRHVPLLQICRICLSQNDLDGALEAASSAARFCRDTYGNPSKEARFWEAVALYRLGRRGVALAIVSELEKQRFQFPGFERLGRLVRQPGNAVGSGACPASSSPALQIIK